MMSYEKTRRVTGLKFRITCDHERLAERVVAESKRVVDETNDTTKSWQREIRFLCEELNFQKKIALLDVEALLTYRKRVLFAIEFLKTKSLAVCQRCFVLREGRIGVDLCDDEVDRQLRREMEIIIDCQSILDKVLQEANEQIRKLRAAIYLLDTDLAQKDKYLNIDERNLNLREWQNNLGKGQDLSQHHCQYSLSEWQHTTSKNVDAHWKELLAASQLRCYINLLLKQVCEDMQNQTDLTNDAFESRMTDMRHVKHCLELKHADALAHITDLTRNINNLEKEKQRSMDLCQTRLSNRAQRPGLELTCDTVQDALYHELEALHATICKLNQKIMKNKATMRYLLHVQMMQEEEINIKTNSLKIDEVDCMGLRQVLQYRSF